MRYDIDPHDTRGNLWRHKQRDVIFMTDNWRHLLKLVKLAIFYSFTTTFRIERMQQPKKYFVCIWMVLKLINEQSFDVVDKCGDYQI